MGFLLFDFLDFLLSFQMILFCSLHQLPVCFSEFLNVAPLPHQTCLLLCHIDCFTSLLWFEKLCYLLILRINWCYSESLKYISDQTTLTFQAFPDSIVSGPKLKYKTYWLHNFVHPVLGHWRSLLCRADVGTPTLIPRVRPPRPLQVTSRLLQKHTHTGMQPCVKL